MKGGCVKKVTNIQIQANVRRGEQATEVQQVIIHAIQDYATKVYADNDIRAVANFAIIVRS